MENNESKNQTKLPPSQTRRKKQEHQTRYVQDKKYRVWFRHSAEPSITDIPDNAWKMERNMTLDEIRGEISDHHITHLHVNGDIPVQIITPQLTHIEIKDLSNINQLESLLRCEHLKALDLLFFDLSSSDTIRTVDHILETCKSSLRKVRFHDSQLTQLPKSLSKLRALEELQLSSNPLSTEAVNGTLNDTLTTYASSLKNLRLDSCNLTTLPKSLSKLRALEELRLSFNPLSTEAVNGTLNDTLKTCASSLKNLHLYSCKLTTLPKSLSKLRELQSLKLPYNRLSTEAVNGTLNDTFTTCASSLTNLRLERCNLTTLPKSLSKLRELQELDLSDNRLSTEAVNGTLNDTLTTCASSLKNLNFHRCNLTTLPKSLSKLRALQTLDLSHNPLSTEAVNGALNDTLTTCASSLTNLDLSSCNLTTLPKRCRST